MVLDAALLNTQPYKVGIKGKVEQSRERSSTLPLHLSVVAIEKGAFRSPSTKVANFTLLLPSMICLYLIPFKTSGEYGWSGKFVHPNEVIVSLILMLVCGQV